MPDAYDVWRSAAGTSKQKSVRTIFPELGAVLDGATGGGEASTSSPAEPQPRCSIKGTWCAGYAVGEFADNGAPACIACFSTVSNQGRRFVRNPAWKVRRPDPNEGRATPEDQWRAHRERRGGQ